MAMRRVIGDIEHLDVSHGAPRVSAERSVGLQPALRSPLPGADVGFYRYAEEEGLIAHSPAVHVRRPRIDYESHAIGLDRNEVGALLVAAGLGPAAEHALVSLLALNGLRVSEAMGANIEALGVERVHRTLTVLRKGGKTVTVPSRLLRVPHGRST